MGNLAYKYSTQQKKQQQQTPMKSPKKVIKETRKITLGEKCLCGLFIAFILFAGVKMISNQVTIYKTNKEIQILEASIQTQQKINNDLHVEKENLSSYERILTKAKELGLKLNEKNVKVVQE